MPWCTAGRTSGSLSRTGWRLRFESTNPLDLERNTAIGDFVWQMGIYLFSIINSLHFHSSPRIQYFSVVSRTTSLKPTAL